MSGAAVRAASSTAASRELATILTQDRWVSTTAHLVLLVIVILHAGSELPRPFLLIWAGTITLTILFRTVLARRAPHTETDPLTVLRLMRVVMVVLGFAWGLGAALAAGQLPPAVSAMLLMALAGLLAGGIGTLVADRWAFPAYALSLFGPTLVALPLLKPQPATSLEMLLIALFLFFMIVQHRRAHETLLSRLQADQNQRSLVLELRTAITEVRTLQGILPICASCKRIHSDGDRWEPVESYVRQHTNAEFSHGLCPDCAARDWGISPKSSKDC